MQARQEAAAHASSGPLGTPGGPLSGANTKSGEDGGSGARGGDGQALRPGHVFYLRGARGTFHTTHSLNTQLSTLSTKHSTRIIQHSTLSTQHSTLSTQHSTLNIQH